MSDHRSPGPVMLDVKGTHLTSDERAILDHPAVGGLILFSRNYRSPEQVAALIADIRAARKGEILIAVDQEGGRVQRFRDGYTPLPAAARYWAHCRGDLAQAAELVREAGWLMAAEVRAVDADFSFAPVLDVDCGVSEIIGDRAFARDAETVATLAAAFIAGMRSAGMPAVGKHFPGHGGVAADSHLALPVDDREWEALWENDLLPYRRLIPAGLDAVMPAHVVYSRLDARPAGFSPFWLQEILRRRLAFDGVIFSDDLSMEGAAGVGGFAERARLALDAGCDMVLVCNNPDAALEVVNAIGETALPDSARRLARLRGQASLPWSSLKQESRWRQAVTTLSAIG